MKFKYAIYAILTIIVWVLCYTVGTARQSNNEKIEVLFVGNSLTYSNNLPAIVKQATLARGVEIEVNMIAFPNYAIVDHLMDGKVQKEIATGKYAYVIIQQGPSSQANGRKMLINDGKILADLCAANGTKLCYFMVWPALTYYHTFERVIANYADAAQINDAVLLPVGQAWKDYFDKDNAFDLYGPDGFHPSMKGSQLAAQVLAEYLSGQLE